MRSRLKVPAIVVPVSLTCLFLTHVFWPIKPGMATPPSSLLPLFVALNVAGCYLFGIGVAFLAYGFPMLKRARQPQWLTVGAYLSIAFLLLNWWPHSNLHSTSGMDFAKIVLIDYGFHVPLMTSGLVLALFFLRTVRASFVATAQPADVVVRPAA